MPTFPPSIDIGRIQTLRILRLSEHGAYLGQPLLESREIPKEAHKRDDTRSEALILLPSKFLPQGASIGDELEVFVMHDSSDRPIAFRGTPKAQCGDIAALSVVSVESFGCFLDIGMEKHIFMPTKNPARFSPGQLVVVRLTLDKQSRLIAKLGLKPYLTPCTHKHPHSSVRALVFERTPLGFGCVVEGAHYGLLYTSELPRTPRIGETLLAYVKATRRDGKLDLVLSAPYSASHKERVLAAMPLRLDFHSSPETIFENLQMSKKLFKRAINELVREGAVGYDSANGGFYRLNS